MKKKVTSLVAFACLIGAVVSASAATNEIKVSSGGIDLDPIIAQNKTIKGVHRGESLKSQLTLTNDLGAPSYAVDAGGGKFWVDYSTYVWSYYNHPTLIHRSSATNSNSTVRSDWKDPFAIADARVPATVSGNKANWDTK
ncbi:lactococcin 972 family bacteriocin [Paenibacillus eucommiae]|uniref:Lactococcin 972 family bacteriocin n=1 Tax=Paenibacillus eucommiae TaxID=1355755 RepID=A0ABS4J997_9BACL|nr:lactococcin 972 family bacteriocin [Paenibacillus eucommiae]MBP1995830.1 lactococcin 972 family bacteriocin [Paenibacillus eucommiae]